MTPQINGIDHVHIYVTDMHEAKAWYSEYLGFQPVPKFGFWNKGAGPLVMADSTGEVHIALFRSDSNPGSVIAFGASGKNFISWVAFLKSKALEVVVKDHQLSWSVYFQDPYGNNHEITTYECDYVRQQQ